MPELVIAAIGTALALGNVLGGLHLVGQLNLIPLPQSRLVPLHRANGVLTLILFVALGATDYLPPGVAMGEAVVLALGTAGYLGKVWVVRRGDAYSRGGTMGIVVLAAWIAALIQALS